MFPSTLVAVIGNGIGMTLPLIAYYALQAKKHAEMTKEGWIYALLAGVAIAGFSMLMTYIFSRAENVSFVMPVIYGGTIVLTTVLGVFLFKEQLTPVSLAGIIIVAIGVGLVTYSRLYN